MKSIATSVKGLFILLGFLFISSAIAQEDQRFEPPQIADQNMPTLPSQLTGEVITPSVFGQRPTVVMLDRILVVVNHEVITQHDLNARVDYVSRQLTGRGVALPPREVLEKQLLERKIMEKIQTQYAEELGVAVTDEHLNEIIQRLIDAQNPGTSVEEFQAALEAEGINYPYFREDLRKEILITVLREQEIDNKIQVSNEEVENYLVNQDVEELLELNLSHIIISIPSEITPEEAETKANTVATIMRELNEGADFAQVAIRYSESQDAIQGGNLGWRSETSLPLLYVEAVQNLPEGEIVGPLQSANGAHVVKLNGRRMSAGESEQIEQYEVRHILIRPDEGKSAEVVQERLLQIREILLSNPESFSDLARQYSEDASGTKGGSIGWVSEGDTVPPFEAAIKRLSVGEISEPIETMYGWHILEVTDKRLADVTEDRKRNVAKRDLKERKVEDTYQQWLREIRDEAFIEYKEQDDWD